MVYWWGGGGGQGLTSILLHNTVEILQSHCIHTVSHWSSGLPVCFPSWGTRVQSPGGYLCETGILLLTLSRYIGDPRRDWSLWPWLRRASSKTVTRPSCRQWDIPTWSHTALLSRFHARCRSPFRLHNWHSQLLGGSPVESLQSHCIHTMSHWSSGLLIRFPSWGSWVQSSGGYLCETRILLLALSRYIGDPDVIDHCGLVWGGLRTEPSLGRRADNVRIPLDLPQLFRPGFTLAAGPPSGFTTNIVGCWGGALWRACNLTAFIHSSTGPVVHPFASCY